MRRRWGDIFVQQGRFTRRQFSSSAARHFSTAIAAPETTQTTRSDTIHEKEASKSSFGRKAAHGDPTRLNPDRSRMNASLAGDVSTDGLNSHFENQNIINASLDKLATEASIEVERLTQEGGIQKEDVKRTVWSILGIFRGVIRGQLKRPGGTADDVRHSGQPVQMQRENAINLNQSIITVAEKTRHDLRTLVMMDSYKRILGNSGNLLNEVHISTMLHRIATVACQSTQRTWILNEYDFVLQPLLTRMAMLMHALEPPSYAAAIWSLGKLGPQLQTMTIDQRPYSYFYQHLLQEGQKRFPEMTAHELTMTAIGCSYSGVSPVILKPFARSLSDELVKKADQLKGHDFSQLTFVFGKMQFERTSLIYTKLCEAAESEMDVLQLKAIGQHLHNLAYLGHPGTPSFIERCAQKIHRNRKNVDAPLLMLIMDNLAAMSYYPELELIDCLNDKMTEAFNEGNVTPDMVVRFTTFCSRISSRPENLLRQCKKHFVERPSVYPLPGLFRFLWGIIALNELDDEVMNALKKTSLPLDQPQRLLLSHRRQFCRLFITLRILRNKEPTDYVSREMEEICYAAWRTFLKNRTSYGIMPELFSVFGRAGFACRHCWILEKIPLVMSSAVLPAATSGWEEDLQLAVDVIPRDQSFTNNTSAYNAIATWRQQLLESQGWQVVHVRPPDWNTCRSAEAKGRFLYDIIKEKTGKSVPALLSVQKHPQAKERSFAGTYEERASGEEDSAPVTEEPKKATLSAEDLGSLSETSEIEDRFKDILEAQSVTDDDDDSVTSATDAKEADQDTDVSDSDESLSDEEFEDDVSDEEDLSFSESDDDGSLFDTVLDNSEEEVADGARRSSPLLSVDDKEISDLDETSQQAPEGVFGKDFDFDVLENEESDSETRDGGKA